MHKLIAEMAVHSLAKCWVTLKIDVDGWHMVIEGIKLAASDGGACCRCLAADDVEQGCG
jgi:hypothetical protein